MSTQGTGGIYNATQPTLLDGAKTSFQVDDRGNLRTTVASASLSQTIGQGVKTVTTAGTDVVLAASTPASWVIIQAQTDNTGIIAVGAAGVDATVATGNGVALAAGDSVTLPVSNLDTIFIDATVSGDGVRYTYA